jgi:hypothetical protein
MARHETEIANILATHGRVKCQLWLSSLVSVKHGTLAHQRAAFGACKQRQAGPEDGDKVLLHEFVHLAEPLTMTMGTDQITHCV